MTKGTLDTVVTKDHAREVLNRCPQAIYHEWADEAHIVRKKHNIQHFFQETSKFYKGLLLSKREDYTKRKYLSPMIESGELEYKYPDMINHPEQAYKAAKMKSQ